MSKTKAAKLKIAPSAGPLKAYFDRVSRLEDEREAVAADAKELTQEIKSAGYNAKAIKRMVKESRRKTDDQLEADLELYRALLSMPGATYRSVAEQTKIPRSTLHRLVPNERRGTKLAHVTTGHDSKGNPLEADSDGVVVENNGSLSPRDAPSDEHSTSCGGVEGHAGTEPMAVMPGAFPIQDGGGLLQQPVVEKEKAGVESGPQDTASQLRSQIPFSTDKARLEREARHAEGACITHAPLDLAQNEVQIGDQRGREPAPPEVNCANGLVQEKGDQPASPAAAINPDEDDLEIPVFLRRMAVPGHAA